MDSEQKTIGTGAGVAATNQTSAEGTAAAAPVERPIEQKFVTEEVFEQKLQEAVRRMRQSDRDRMKTIDDKLTAMKTRLEAGGSQLTQQQVSALREEIENDLDPDKSAQATERDANPSPERLTPEMQRQADFVFDQLDATFAEVGETVTPNDPEWAEIKAVLDNPKGSLPKLIRVAIKQAEAKQARKNTQSAGAAARVVSAGVTQSGGDSLGADVTGHDLFQRAHR